MGNWGKTLYENDTALDVLEEIDAIFSEETDNHIACSRILSVLKSSYSDTDDQSIAYLAAAYQLVPRSRKLVSELYKSLQKSSGILPEETVQMLEAQISECGRKPRQKRAKNPKAPGMSVTSTATI